MKSSITEIRLITASVAKLMLHCAAVHFKFDTQRCVNTKLHILRECLDLKDPLVLQNEYCSAHLMKK